MTARQASHTLSNRVKESIEVAQDRLAHLEKEAQKVVNELVEKGKASRKDVEVRLAKFKPEEILDIEVVKGLQGRAKDLAKDLSHRLEDLRQRVVTLAGVASTEQVNEIARDLDKLSRKLDKIVGKKPAAPRAE